MNTLDQHDWHETLDVLCHSSACQILEGISFSEFRARMVGMLEFLLDAMAIPEEVRTPEMKQSMATLVALEIWNATPIPENRFRPRKQAEPERNAPCLCGSGRRHYLDLWRASGALKWGAGIRITAPTTAKKSAEKPENDQNGALF
jgi:hypothetical protein